MLGFPLDTALVLLIIPLFLALFQLGYSYWRRD